MKFIIVLSFVMNFSLLAQERVAMEREGGGRPSANAVYVVFSSFGTGINNYTKSLAKEYIDNGIENNTIKKATFERWGREGEITFCADFRKSEDRVRFVNAIYSSIIDDHNGLPIKRTDVLVGIDCEDISKATSQQIGTY
jgi:hypothetical protein